MYVLRHLNILLICFVLSFIALKNSNEIVATENSVASVGIFNLYENTPWETMEDWSDMSETIPETPILDETMQKDIKIPERISEEQVVNLSSLFRCAHLSSKILKLASIDSCTSDISSAGKPNDSFLVRTTDSAFSGLGSLFNGMFGLSNSGTSLSNQGNQLLQQIQQGQGAQNQGAQNQGAQNNTGNGGQGIFRPSTSQNSQTSLVIGPSTAVPVPEPSMWLILSGMLMIILASKRRIFSVTKAQNPHF